MVVIGDVAGHARPQALTASPAPALRTAGADRRPVRAISQLNDTLRERPTWRCARCLPALHMATASAARSVIASAGHPLPVLVRDGQATPLGRAGPARRRVGDVDWPVREASSGQGDVLVLFTDGVLDAISHRGRLDETRPRPPARGAGDRRRA